ncbi:hypothetical protein [Lysobacter arvi]|uniref:Restriction endonuclease type IV Mrr domain-containing protein n=1 Tax=Lysobacter arvi TaxID=3038776 RepID=A0ABU1CH31_9GAMM|nr:hypothetical protein [Lysobacter arvi]MDR0184255.1 hypothetical protein [Lysobacter arvi]
MYVTEKINPLELLSQLLTCPVAGKVDRNFEGLSHNDHLCPKFEELIRAILGAYKRHRSSAYDIQGFTDHGADILVSWEDDDGDMQSAALQVKSYREVEQDLKMESGKRQLIPALKSQYVNAMSKHRVGTFYVVLCCDGGKKHRDFVRRVSAEFTSLPGVKIIGPAQAWAFYEMLPGSVVAHCARVLCAADPLLRDVGDMFESKSKAFRWAAINAIVQNLEDKRPLEIDDLEMLDVSAQEESWQEDVEQAIQDLLWSGDLESVDGSTFELSHEAFLPLRALYYDVRARHGLSGGHMVTFLMQITDQSDIP